MGLAHHSGGPLETFLEEPRAGLVEGVGAAGQPALLPTNTLPIYKRRWKAGQGQCLGKRAMRLGLRSPQSWQVAPQRGDGQQADAPRHGALLLEARPRPCSSP